VPILQPEHLVTDYKELGLSCFGPATFVKAPMVDPHDNWSADIAALGVPFDAGTGFRPGTRWGSRAIRDMSVRFSAISAPGKPGFWDMRTGKDRAVCSFVDCGDVDIVPLLWEQNFDAITAAVKAILRNKALPFTFGGDHSITFPVVRAFDGIEPITVVQFDAHIDYRDEAMGVRYGHGNVLRRVRELPFVEQIVSIGIRSSRTRRQDYEDSIAAGNVIIPSWDVHSKSLDELAKLLPFGRNVYITFDIDAMESGIAPGTGTPEPGGLHYEQARAFLERITETNKIVGFDLVEVNPLLDAAGITGLLAAQIAVDVAGFLYSR
jgi:agmatinase